MDNDKSLISAVRMLESKGDSKSKLLDDHVGDLGVLVDEGVVLSDILKGLKNIGVEVSKTLLQSYLKSNFPTSYKKNYTDRLNGGRKAGSTNRPKAAPSKEQNKTVEKPNLDCQQSESSGVVSDMAQSESALPSSETNDMVNKFLEENTNLDKK